MLNELASGLYLLLSKKVCLVRLEFRTTYNSLPEAFHLE